MHHYTHSKETPYLDAVGYGSAKPGKTRSRQESADEDLCRDSKGYPTSLIPH